MSCFQVEVVLFSAIVTIKTTSAVKRIDIGAMFDWVGAFNIVFVVHHLDCLQDRGNMLFKQVHEGKSLKGRSNDAIASACTYIACRQEGVPRTFKGINVVPINQFYR